MELIIAFLISWVIGTLLVLLIGKFSMDPPNLILSFIGAFILEILYFILKGLPSLIFFPIYIIITWIIVIKITGIERTYAFFGAIAYIGLKLIASLLVLYII